MFKTLFESDDYIRINEMLRRGKRLMPHNTYHLKRTELEKMEFNKDHEYFFGVCPRVAEWANYEHQIRKVNFLWADVDNKELTITPDDCLYPTVVVNSGRGWHLYWKLKEPIHITDAGTLFRVERIGKQKFWVDPDGETWNPRWGSPPDMQESEIAAKVLGHCRGLAQYVGGDHVYNLSRVLRVPGTFNHKSGSPLVASVVSMGTQTFGLDDFPFIATSGSKKYAAPVPPREAQTFSPMLRLLLVNSQTACCGNRSEADYKLVRACKASGINQATLWHTVKTWGKFAEKGWDYFERTWNNA